MRALLCAALALSALATTARAAPPTQVTSRPAPAVRRYVLLAVEQINVEPAMRQQIETQLLSLLRERARRAEVWTLPRTGVTAPPSDCLQQNACLRDHARRLEAQRLLTLRLGLLGDTLMLRLTVYDPEGVKRGSWQEVLKPRDQAALTAALERMVGSLAPAPPVIVRRERSWYRRWWVWTLVGVAVAGAITTTVLVTRDTDPSADHRITLP